MTIMQIIEEQVFTYLMVSQRLNFTISEESVLVMVGKSPFSLFRKKKRVSTFLCIPKHLFIILFYPPITHPLIHPSFYPLLHPFIHLFIHLPSQPLTDLGNIC